MRKINWTVSGKGYEVTTRGDKRFSAFVARMPDGRTIEDHYQVSVKGYRTWREGKGRPPLDPSVDLFVEYLKLWKTWAFHHPDLIDELLVVLKNHNDTLKDRFATTRVNQAHALSVILNERIENDKRT